MSPVMGTIALGIAGAALGYVATVIGDFMIHRYIWHGKWRIVHTGPLKKWLYPHYVHHYVAHHRHALDARKAILRTARVPVAHHQAVEAEFADDPWVVRALKCSEHGLSIRNVECGVNYYTLFLLTPVPRVIALLAWWLGPVAAAAATLMSFTAIFTQINHRYYHVKADTRRALVPRWLRWFFLSKEFGRLAQEHRKHHFAPQDADRYYSVLPFSKPVLRVVFGTW